MFFSVAISTENNNVCKNSDNTLYCGRWGWKPFNVLALTFGYMLLRFRVRLYTLSSHPSLFIVWQIKPDNSDFQRFWQICILSKFEALYVSNVNSGYKYIYDVLHIDRIPGEPPISFINICFYKRISLIWVKGIPKDIDEQRWVCRVGFRSQTGKRLFSIKTQCPLTGWHYTLCGSAVTS